MLKLFPVNYNVDPVLFPGTTFLDHDCETSSSYDGFYQGTVSVLGYAEEYRGYQLSLQTRLDLHLESQKIPPAMAIDKIVERIQALKLRPDLEDDNQLAQILGLPS